MQGLCIEDWNLNCISRQGVGIGVADELDAGTGKGEDTKSVG
jgi:hypothetical protein